MNAYRIGNDIFAARDSQQAIAAWAKHYNAPAAEAGPVEDVPLDLEIQIEEPEGEYRPGKLSEVMPDAGEAQLVCFGSCDDCDR